LFYLWLLAMKIISWNVNGIRAVMKKWFLDWVTVENPDILCLQETKAFEVQIPAELRFVVADYDYVWHQWTRPWYAGTAIFFKKSLNVISKISKFESVEKFNDDGRVTELRFIDKWKEVVLLNIYFPNWWTRADGQEMLSYKLWFYDNYLYYIQQLELEWKLVISCGDFNICHKEIDIARPDANKNSIWFLPIEREKIWTVFDSGFVDVFRKFYPDLLDQYTRWSYRAGARPRNVWRRLDYFVVSENLLDNIIWIDHLTDVMGSDHCPIRLLLKD